MRYELPGGGQASFTTRVEGNLSTLRGPDPEHGRERREHLCAGLDLDWLCASRQVHGAAVQRVMALAERGMLAASGMRAKRVSPESVDGECLPTSVEGESLPASVETGARAVGACLPASVRGSGEAVALDADGHATALHGVGAMVLVADCLPVALGAEGAVAALHAGWRGLAAGVLEEGVRALRELGGDGEIAAVIGPGARVCCYEVGEEVHAVFGGVHRAGRNLDLAAHARERLRAAGVASVEEVGVCTICDERFFSYRREGDAAGRQAGVAWLS
ncbi:MAG TPA: polyphenol oxidase family protein [Solirubrobacteraceae bacterium]|jgi:YfiH family protein|nr:polyphenol oxidase family protein [Solirubrobacteraceae bacterium]